MAHHHHGHGPKKEDAKFEPTNELEKRIMEKFEAYDHSGKHTVENKEIGIVMRSLGCCPTEAEILEVIRATENKDSEVKGHVPLAHFLPYMVKAMTEHRFYPASAEELLTAFKYFDSDKHGYLTKERFKQLMTEEGEPFNEEDFNDLMLTTLDPVTDTVTYEYYINQLVIVSKEIYNIADALEEERLKIEAAAPKKRNLMELAK